jgi:hypothetical protein
MKMSSISNVPGEKSGWRAWGTSWACPLISAFLALGLGNPARSQESPHPAGSIAEAARNARAQKSKSTKPPKVVTNDELSGQPSEPPALASSPPGSASPADSSTTNAVESPKPAAGGCDNPDAERVKAELQATQEELDQIRRELSYNPEVISGGNLDMKNFKPGKSGLDVGGPPLRESKPLVPARMTEVSLQEKIASLRKALRIACDSPEDAGIQAKLDQAEQELSTLQREFNLDRSDYYSKTNYAADAAAKAKLDAEQRQIQDLQSEIERLKSQLAAPNRKVQ